MYMYININRNSDKFVLSYIRNYTKVGYEQNLMHGCTKNCIYKKL